uniref:Uncharacterized protein n=1 Tax=Arundo donax TaxID=35708 RepID=A0A0A8XNC9_ARUDO
MCRRMRRI